MTNSVLWGALGLGLGAFIGFGMARLRGWLDRYKRPTTGWFDAGHPENVSAFLTQESRKPLKSAEQVAKWRSDFLSQESRRVHGRD